MKVRLLDGFEFTSGGTAVDLPLPSAKVLAYLGVAREREMERQRVARAVWPAAEPARAMANLRSALWRLPVPARAAVVTRSRSLALAPKVERDIDVFSNGQRRPSLDQFMAELLPGWEDDWVLVEREWLRVVRLGLLERLSETCRRDGDITGAVLHAYAAVAIEPLHEATHRLLLRAYLAEGNRFEALGHYRNFRRLLREELGVDPSPETSRILTDTGVTLL